MKNLTLFALVILLTQFSFSQTMIVHKTDHTRVNVTLSQIDSIKFSLQDLPIEGMVAYYPFSGNANDSSGKGHHGSVNGATLSADRFGNANSSYYFDGSSNSITVAHDTLFDLKGMNSLTVSCWMKAVVPNPYHSGLWCKANPEGCSNYCIWFNGTHGDSLTVNVNDHCSSTSIVRFINGSAASWHNIVVVFDSLNVSMYSDGNLVKQDVFTRTPEPNTSRLYFGDDSDGGQNYFNGYMDDIRI